MFDINALINNAITTAVTEAIKPLVERIEALENIAAEYTPAPAVTPATITADAFVTHLDNQEWFWHKVAGFVTNNSEITANDVEVLKDRVNALEESNGLARGDVGALIKRAMDRHTEEFNHDSYDDVVSEIEDIDFDDYVKTDDIRDAVRDAVQDLSFEIRVR